VTATRTMPSVEHTLKIGRRSWTAIFLASCLLPCTGCAEKRATPPTAGGAAPSASAPAAPTGGAGLKRFIFVTNGDDPFWDACNAGLVEGAKRFDIAANGLRVVMEKNNGTAQGQIEKLRQFGTQSDVAGVAISVIQAENAAIVEEMKNLAAKGVKVITVDGDVNRDTFRDARPFYIGTDNIEGGRLLGATAKRLLESRGRKDGGYVQFAGFTDNDNARARMNGFKETVGEAFKEVDRMSDEMDLSKARDNVRTALVNHPDLAALVGIWAYNAPAIAEVVQERSARERLTIVTFDAQALALNHMAEGRIDAMVVQNPFEMGIQTVRLLRAMHLEDEGTIKEMFPGRGGPDGDIFTTGLRLIVPEGPTPLIEGDGGAAPGGMKNVEVMRLPAFREWLAKYGLSSS
ncbi:MAG: substrate-binding domain-containing protein, partial [Planctomycetia bacterium]